MGLGAASAAMGFVLLLTQSRSAYTGAVVAVLLVLIWWRFAGSRSRLPARPALAVVVVLAAAGGAAVWHLVATWAGGNPSGSDSFPSRLELWGRGLLMLQDFPYTGVGIGQFTPVLRDLYVPFLLSPGTNPGHTHNFFLQLGLDFGIPGGVAALFLLGAFFHCLCVAYRGTEDRRIRAAAVGLAAGMIGFLVFGLTDAVVLGARGAIGLWAILGLGAALARLTEPTALPVGDH